MRADRRRESPAVRKVERRRVGNEETGAGELADQALPRYVPEPTRTDARARPDWPGLSQVTKDDIPPELNGIAVAITPRAEYAVAETTGAPSGMANPTRRTPETRAGCKVSTMPLPSRTVT